MARVRLALALGRGGSFVDAKGTPCRWLPIAEQHSTYPLQGRIPLSLPNYRPGQRSTYRVRPAGDGSEVFVALPTGPVQAILEDLNSRGCGVIVGSEAGAGLEVQKEVVLRLLVGGPGMPQLFAKGVIRGLRQVQEGVRIAVEFSDPKRLYTQLKEPQWRFFNRREAFRVPPADGRGRPLRAKFFLLGAKEGRSLPIHDLSSTGLSVWLAPKNDVVFPKHLPVRVTFNLPGDEAGLDLRVILVHRTKLEGKFRIGFQIVVDRTVDAEDQAERILQYVLERQRQLLAAA